MHSTPPRIGVRRFRSKQDVAEGKFVPSAKSTPVVSLRAAKRFVPTGHEAYAFALGHVGVISMGAVPEVGEFAIGSPDTSRPSGEERCAKRGGFIDGRDFDRTIQKVGLELH